MVVLVVVELDVLVVVEVVGGISVVVLVVVDVELDVVVVVVPVQSSLVVQGRVPPVTKIPSSPKGKVEEQTLALKPVSRELITGTPVSHGVYSKLSVISDVFSTV